MKDRSGERREEPVWRRSCRRVPAAARWLIAAAAVVTLASLVLSRWSARSETRRSERPAVGDREQAEEIVAKRPRRMPRVVGRRDLAAHLWRSFGAWTPEGPTAAAALAQRDQARMSLERAGGNGDLTALLGAATGAEQIYWALEQALVDGGTRYFDPAVGHELTARLRALTAEPAEVVLPVQASIVVRAVSIPEAAKDEVRIDLSVYSGAPLDELTRFMAANRMIAPGAAPKLAAQWKRTDAAIGDQPEEREALAKCLGLIAARASEQRETDITYNYGLYTKFIWRNAAMTIHLPVRFETSRYPFDRTLVKLALMPSAAVDISRVTLAPEAPAPPPVDPATTVGPRGFYFSRQSPALEAIAKQESANSVPIAALLWGFELTRRLDSALWRTFVPALLIVLYALIASLRALARDENIPNVMTSMLPSLTLACVALQWTASSMIPTNAGRTVMDEIFVCIYLHLFFLFLALSAHHVKALARGLLAMSLAVFAYGLHYFL